MSPIILYPSTDPNAVYCLADPGAETTARDINHGALMAGSSTDYGSSPVRTKPVVCDADGTVTVRPLTGDVVEATATKVTNNGYVLGQGWDQYHRSRVLVWTIH